MKKKAVVTGGAGFIGSHVVDAYIEEGWEVLVVDDLSTGKMENINRKADFLQMDIRDRKIRDVIRKFSPSLINHHAAQINLRKSVEEPLNDADINIKGTINILEAMRENKVEKIIFASTGGAIYGETEVIPTPETHPPSPLSPYGIAKRACELYINYYSSVWGISSTILRYGNVYGPRQDPLGEAGVIAIFISKVMRGERPVIFGDGNQTRDYVYVGDVVKFNLMIHEKQLTGIYNIGTGIETSVNKLFSLIKNLMDTSLEPVYDAPRPGELRRSALCAEKAKGLGWNPIPLEEGLKITIEWFRKRK